MKVVKGREKALPPGGRWYKFVDMRPETDDKRRLATRFGITAKLVAAFISTTAVAVAAMVLALSYFADRSFEEYLARRELAALDGLSERLLDYYREEGSWDGLRQDPGQWKSILIAEARDNYSGSEARELEERIRRMPARPGGAPSLQGPGRDEFQPPERSGPRGPAMDRPPPRDRPFPGGRPPPEGRRGENDRPGAGSRPGPPGERGPMGGGLAPGGTDSDGRRSAGLKELLPRVTLFDKDLAPVTGGSPDSRQYRLLELASGGRTAGYLGVHRAPSVAHAMDRRFLREQTWTLYATGGLAMLLASAVAALLARGISGPLKRLARAAGSVAGRDFETRVPVETSDEIGLLARDFNKMAERLGRFERRQRQWIDDIAHELRNPLSVLTGEIEAMEDGVRKVDPSSLASLLTEVRRLNKIVEDLRTLSLADTGDLKMRPAPLDPAAVFLEALGPRRASLESEGISVETDFGGLGGKAVAADRDRLGQVFANLVDNARKYMDKPGVLAARGRESGGHVVISVEDTGPGVPEESLELIFDRLYRVDKSRSRETGGGGLGLSICRSIVEAHGGEVRARRSAAGGLAVEVALPLSAAAATGRKRGDMGT